MKNRYLVALTGASGVRYGVALLRAMKEMGIDADLVVSETAEDILRFEERTEVGELSAYAVKVYPNHDLFSPPASGSVLYAAMVIVPCSMTTAGKINSCIGDNLVTRAAQVFMKEGRKLVLVPRETPLSTAHLRVLYELSSMGVVVMPAAPGFYHHPEGLKGIEDFMVQRILDLIGVDADLMEPFEGR